MRERTMAAIREKSAGEPEDASDAVFSGPATKVLRWSHVGVTVALCALLYNFWGDWRGAERVAGDERTKLEARISVLESDAKHISDHERAQNDTVTKQIIALTQRIDAQREDIRLLQSLIIRHMDRLLPAK